MSRRFDASSMPKQYRVGENYTDDLRRALKETAHPVYRFSVKENEKYDFPHRLFGEQNCLYDFSVYADYVGMNAVKFMLTVRRFVAGIPVPELLHSSGWGLESGGAIDFDEIPWQLKLENAAETTAQFKLVHRRKA